MIAVKNTKEEDKNSFEDILKTLDKELNDANSKPETQNTWNEVAGERYEEELCSRLLRLVHKTKFEGKIERIGGQKFPDLVAWVDQLNGYGIEAKTTKKNNWKSTGSSIKESSRVDNVEKIYLSFAKLGGDIPEFRTRLYEDCLTDIAITHSPRYLIDMDIDKDSSIFSKIGHSYDEVRTSKNPFSYMRAYYEQNHRSWWMEDNDSMSSPVITFFNTLTNDERENYKKCIFLRCPEVLRNSGAEKYNRASIYLLQQSIIHPSIRDSFSAGGTSNVSLFGVIYTVPKVVAKFTVWVSSVSYKQELCDLIPEGFSFDTWVSDVKQHLDTYDEDRVSKDFIGKIIRML